MSNDGGVTWIDVSPLETAPSGDPIATYDTLQECQEIPPTPTPQHRTISGETFCFGDDKMVRVLYQVSYDSGSTWITTDWSILLVEKDSSDCGSVPSYMYRTITGTPYCSGYDKVAEVEYQVSYNGGSTWQTTATTTVMIEHNSSDCGYIAPEYRTTSGTPYCQGYDKYVDVYSQVSYDSGSTWTTTATTATLIEHNSADCGYVPPTPTPQYRTTSGTPYCQGYDKYVDVYSQVSYDSGSTWTTTATTPTLVEHNSADCGYVPPTGNVITYTAYQQLNTSLYNFTPTATAHTFDNGVGRIEFNSDATAITIKMYTFSQSSGLTSIDLPNTITSIGDSAFYSCSGLTSIDIPNSVTSIGNWTFQNCTSLTSCTIGSGVTSIGEGAFFQSSGLTSITINATTPPTVESITFYSTNNYPIYVPAESVNAYKSASGWSTYASRIQAIP